MSDQQNKVPRDMRACHEAGHAVAAHVFGISIDLVDIKEDEKHGGNFRVVLPWGSTIPHVWRYNYLREFVEQYDVMLMAGFPASLIAEGALPDPGRVSGKSDQDKLWQDAHDAFPNLFEDAWIKDMSVRRNELTPEAVEAIEELSERHRKLADAYFAWIRLRAEVLVQFPAHRHAINVLAAELLEKEALTGPQAHAIIAAALAEYPTVKERA